MYEVNEMDDVDKMIIAYIQKQFPISDRPYLEIAKELGLDEDEVKERIKNLHKKGYIIKIMPKFSIKFYEKYERALVAMVINDEILGKAVDLINSYENITHNYLRDHRYNVWFTIYGKNLEKINEQVKEIANNLNVKDYMILKSVKTLKLDTEFEVK